jgi:hypothetical protein
MWFPELGGSTASNSPIYQKKATVVATEAHISSGYDDSPVTHIHMIADVDMEGDWRLMHMTLKAPDFVAAPLMLAEEQCQIVALSFSGDKVYPMKFVPLWPNLRQAAKLAKGADSEEITMQALIVDKVETIALDSIGYSKAEVHFRVALLCADGSTQSAFFKLKPHDCSNVLVPVGEKVTLTFKESYDEPGCLNVKQLGVDWAAFRKAQLAKRAVEIAA